MKNITEIILTYRNALMNVWNTYYVKENSQKEIFKFETDKGFSLVNEGLFDSLVQAKIFDFALEADKYGCWEIQIVPKNDVVEAMLGTKHGQDFVFKNIKVERDSSVFKYMELFDWVSEGKMKCEFIKTKRFDSFTVHPDTEYLFKFEDVDFYIKDN